MSLSDDDRCVAPDWNLTKLREKRGPRHAHAYLKAYWVGWIASPMIGPIPQGGWAQLTLGCLAVEASAYFLKPISAWKGVFWGEDKHGTPLSVVKSKTELASGRASCWMANEIFKSHVPASFTVSEFAEALFGVYRCGLAHRGLSKNCSVKNVLGVIGGHGGRGPIFRYLGVHAGKRVLSVDPDKFVRRVDDWFRRRVLSAMWLQSDPDVISAFKAWCAERWDIPQSHWTF